MEERLNQILKIALKHHVTDIHLSLSDEACMIEMRVSGAIRRIRSKPDDVKFFHYLMYRANLDLSSSLEPQTGRFEATVNGRTLALRFATVSSYRVTSGVLRILNNHGILSPARPEAERPQRSIRSWMKSREKRSLHWKIRSKC